MFRAVRIVFAVSLVLLAPLGAAHAASREEIHAQIEQLHGNADGLDDAFSALSQALTQGDPGDFVEMVEYPILVQANGESYDIASSDDMLADFNTLVSVKTVEQLTTQSYTDLIVTSDGVGFANGTVWMAAVCEDSACSASHWAITAINN